MQLVYLAIPMMCLVASIVVGLFGWKIGRIAAHSITTLAVAFSFALSVVVFLDVRDGNIFNGPLYTWLISGGVPFEIGFLIDELSATMMVVVTFISLMVHIYTIGYMHDDPGYQRFFSYISMFTFAMLMLVMSNNFLQLFFGWEAVGLISYLLIGFWFEKESAIFANLKAFLVNRVSDFGFLLGIAGVFYVFGTLDYAAVFSTAPQVVEEGSMLEIISGVQWSWITVITLCLFVGAMGKSAQVPLHVWLPDSMEGPTPISALIHAATMVTAGIFMVARMSPLFELSETALTVVLVIGSLTAILMALVGVVQNDVKKIIAYSTLSQLGYMTAALGASAYSIAIFHLGTHAFFKALLFLGAGSVILAAHHEQDIRKMGGLKADMPITYLTAIVGSLALSGIPPFSGFFSKDLIIEVVRVSTLPGAGIAYVVLTISVFVTALYSFRLIFLVFHGKSRMDKHTRQRVKESPWVVTLPLILLAIGSFALGIIYFEPILMANFFGESIKVLPEHHTVNRVAGSFQGESGTQLIFTAIWHGLKAPPIWLALGGIFCAWLLYVKVPGLPDRIQNKFQLVYRMLDKKYGFDEFNQFVFAKGARNIGKLFWRVGDATLIDGIAVNGTARLVVWVSGVIRVVQSGFVYHYAFAMVIGLLVLMTWFMYLR